MLQKLKPNSKNRKLLKQILLELTHMLQKVSLILLGLNQGIMKIVKKLTRCISTSVV